MRGNDVYHIAESSARHLPVPLEKGRQRTAWADVNRSAAWLIGVSLIIGNCPAAVPTGPVPCWQVVEALPERWRYARTD